MSINFQQHAREGAEVASAWQKHLIELKRFKCSMYIAVAVQLALNGVFIYQPILQLHGSVINVLRVDLTVELKLISPEDRMRTLWKLSWFRYLGTYKQCNRVYGGISFDSRRKQLHQV